MDKLTQEKADAYKESPCTCPICGESDDLEAFYRLTQADDLKAWAPVKCHACGNEWHENFIMIGISQGETYIDFTPEPVKRRVLCVQEVENEDMEPYIAMLLYPGKDQFGLLLGPGLIVRDLDCPTDIIGQKQFATFLEDAQQKAKLWDADLQVAEYLLDGES